MMNFILPILSCFLWFFLGFLWGYRHGRHQIACLGCGDYCRQCLHHECCRED